MTTSQLSVTVAIPTFQRNQELAGLLPCLLRQVEDAHEREDVDLLVVDNDPRAGARRVIETLRHPRIRYVVEPRPGIAAARNRALDESQGRDVLIFIDDDERPTELWLRRMLDARDRFAAAAVAGPVRSEFLGQLDAWIDAGAFFGRRHRSHLQTGDPISIAATNNLLLDLREVRRLGVRFSLDVGFAGGEDNLFTRELAEAGGLIIWCADAWVSETVPADRATRRWVLLRSLSSGNGFSRVALMSARGRRARIQVRLSLVGAATLRIAAGTVRWLVGCLSASLRHQARGMRTAVRGAGMLLGAVGYSHQEYRRENEGPDNVFAGVGS